MCTVVTMRAREQRHVLNHPQDRNVRLLEHVYTFDGVFEGNVLRGGYNDGAYYESETVNYGFVQHTVKDDLLCNC